MGKVAKSGKRGEKLVNVICGEKWGKWLKVGKSDEK